MKFAIAVLADFDVVNSTVRRVLMMAEALRVVGHEVHVLIPQRFNAGPQEERREGLTLHWGATTSLTQWRSPASRLRGRWGAIRAVRRLASEGLDWLILYNLGAEGLALLTAAHRSGTRVAAEYCDARIEPSNPRTEDRLRTMWHRVADAVVPRRTDLNIGISHYLVDWLRAKAPGTPAVLLPPLVDADLFQADAQKAEAFRRQWAIGDEPVIGYLGSYWQVEGVATLLRAASVLASAGDRFKLVVSGTTVPGRDCDAVSDLVCTLGLQHHVVQTGWLPTDGVISAMSAADILVVPKTDHIANRAGVPTKMAEYLSMARPVVATSVGDVAFHLRDGIDALLCQPDNPADLSGKLRRLMNDPEERVRLGANGRQTAIARFDYRSVGRQLEAGGAFPSARERSA